MLHGPYHVEAQICQQRTMIIDNKFTNGVRFEGSDGWIFVSRGGSKATCQRSDQLSRKALGCQRSQNPQSKIGPNDISSTCEPRSSPGLAHEPFRPVNRR